MKNFTDLEVWKKAHQIVLNTYKITKYYPAEEKYVLAPQIRRAAISIAANIAEGFKQKTLKGKVNMYNIALASLEEVKYYPILSKDLNYYTETNNINELCNEVGKMLNGLMASLKTKSYLLSTNT